MLEKDIITHYIIGDILMLEEENFKEIVEVEALNPVRLKLLWSNVDYKDSYNGLTFGCSAFAPNANIGKISKELLKTYRMLYET